MKLKNGSVDYLYYSEDPRPCSPSSRKYVFLSEHMIKNIKPIKKFSDRTRRFDKLDDAFDGT